MKTRWFSYPGNTCVNERPEQHHSQDGWLKHADVRGSGAFASVPQQRSTDEELHQAGTGRRPQSLRSAPAAIRGPSLCVNVCCLNPNLGLKPNSPLMGETPNPYGFNGPWESLSGQVAEMMRGMFHLRTQACSVGMVLQCSQAFYGKNTAARADAHHQKD